MNKIIEVNGKRVRLNSGISRFGKSAYVISQEIMKAFESIGIEREYINLTLPRTTEKMGLSANVSWQVNGEDHNYSCNSQERYVDNLGCIGRVIVQDCYAIRKGMKSFGQVMNQFKIGYDPSGGEVYVDPYKVLGIERSCKDKDYVNFKYKQLAKKYHSDVGGDPEKFKQITAARELLLKKIGVD